MIEKNIEILLSDFRALHSEYQIENFIIGGQGDAWAKYKQCLREIANRHESLLNQKESLEHFDLKRCWYGFGKVARIKKSARSRLRKTMINGIAEIERELERFISLAIELKNQLGEIDERKRAELEAGSWRFKALRMAGIDLLVNGRIGHPTMDLILMLPEKDRGGVLKILSPDARPDPFKLLGMNDD